MDKTADDEIRERQARMRNVHADMAQVSWLRELVDEITRLRYDLARLADRKPE